MEVATSPVYIPGFLLDTAPAHLHHLPPPFLSSSQKLEVVLVGQADDKGSVPCSPPPEVRGHVEKTEDFYSFSVYTHRQGERNAKN